MSADLRIQRITTAAALAALEPAWWRLWRAIPDASPFTSPAWLISWWRIFVPGELRTIAVWRGEDLVALAPLYLERGPYGIRLLPLGIGISDSFDVLLESSATSLERAKPVLMQALAAEPDWECLSLEELPPSAAALGLPCPPGCTDVLADQSASPILSLASAEDPLACLPSRKRRKLRMAQNRVARRDGEVRAIGAEEVDDFLADLGRLHGARWRSRGEDGVLADDLVQQFHAAALPRLVAAGLARLYTLAIEDRVVGAYYGLQHGRTAYAYIGGFDPDFAFESPGTVLIGHAIEEAARGGATAFNFLRGQEPYKYEWGAVDRWSRRRTIPRHG